MGFGWLVIESFGSLERWIGKNGPLAFTLMAVPSPGSDRVLVALVLLAPTGRWDAYCLNFLGGNSPELVLSCCLSFLLSGPGIFLANTAQPNSGFCASLTYLPPSPLAECPACWASLVSSIRFGDGSVTWEPFASSHNTSGVLLSMPVFDLEWL